MLGATQQCVNQFPHPSLLRRIAWCSFVIGLVGGDLDGRLTSAELGYNRDIRPLLSEKCFSCHGFDEKARRPDRRRKAED